MACKPVQSHLVQPLLTHIAGVVHPLPVRPALLLPVVRLLQLLLQPHRLPRLQQGLPEGLPEVHTQGGMMGFISTGVSQSVNQLKRDSRNLWP